MNVCIHVYALYTRMYVFARTSGAVSRAAPLWLKFIHICARSTEFYVHAPAKDCAVGHRGAQTADNYGVSQHRSMMRRSRHAAAARSLFGTCFNVGKDCGGCSILVRGEQRDGTHRRIKQAIEFSSNSKRSCLKSNVFVASVLVPLF
jgi:hypothetical protein